MSTADQTGVNSSYDVARRYTPSHATGSAGSEGDARRAACPVLETRTKYQPYRGPVLAKKSPDEKGDDTGAAGTVITYELMPTKEEGEDGLPAMGVPARRGVR
jgi:hypothetical protein